MTVDVVILETWIAVVALVDGFSKSEKRAFCGWCILRRSWWDDLGYHCSCADRYLYSIAKDKQSI